MTKGFFHVGIVSTDSVWIDQICERVSQEKKCPIAIHLFSRTPDALQTNLWVIDARSMEAGSSCATTFLRRKSNNRDTTECWVIHPPVKKFEVLSGNTVICGMDASRTADIIVQRSNKELPFELDCMFARLIQNSECYESDGNFSEAYHPLKNFVFSIDIPQITIEGNVRLTNLCMRMDKMHCTKRHRDRLKAALIRMNSQESIVTIWLCWARLLEQLHKFSDVREIIREIFPLIKAHSRISHIQALEILGRIEVTEGNFRKAKILHNDALSLCEENENAHRMHVSILWTKMFLQKKDPARSFQYLYKAIQNISSAHILDENIFEKMMAVMVSEIPRKQFEAMIDIAIAELTYIGRNPLFIGKLYWIKMHLQIQRGHFPSALRMIEYASQEWSDYPHLKFKALHQKIILLQELGELQEIVHSIKECKLLLANHEAPLEILVDIGKRAKEMGLFISLDFFAKIFETPPLPDSRMMSEIQKNISDIYAVKN